MIMLKRNVATHHWPGVSKCEGGEVDEGGFCFVSLLYNAFSVTRLHSIDNTVISE
jgi:hypothetical protein